jgi:hypothetical protein
MSCKSPGIDLRMALLVAFGDDKDASSRQRILRCQTKEQLSAFCISQPADSLIFVFDQFNGVQEDSTFKEPYKGSNQDTTREFLEQVRISTFTAVRYKLPLGIVFSAEL